MSEHTELLTEARELANKLKGLTGIPFTDGRPGGTVKRTPPTLDECWRSTDMLRGLAKLVEQQDAIIAETVAACKTCDEAIGDLLSAMDGMWTPGTTKSWLNLRAAGNQAGDAVKLAEPKGDVDEEQLSESGAQADFDETVLAELDAEDAADLADAVSDDRASPPAVSAETATAPKLDAVITAGGPTVTGICADLLRQTVPGQPPVEVEMRVQRMPSNVVGYWVWNHRLGETWFAEIGLAGEVRYTSEQAARDYGNAWLSALSDQLGVRLVAVWPDKVNDEARCQKCGGPVARIRGEVTTICSGCASDF